MKQVLQSLANGQTMMVESPAPTARAGHVLVDTTVSLVSAGTERMLVDFSRSGLIAKARSQPEKVRQVLDKAKADGLLTTIEAVRSKLANPLPLGYSSVGRVRAFGTGVVGLAPGDRVVSNGPHADVVSIPKNLCAKVPDSVDDVAASFTVIASIGLQGIRLANPSLGECFVVTGVGLIGLLTVQMLRANGCRVLAIDFDAEKLELARGFGASVCNLGQCEDPVSVAMAFTGGVGVDGVIITASTKSSDPVAQAAHMCRKRARIVLVGVTGLNLNRADFYEKELTFQVSCSYGPGRYDPQYEERGIDYPLGFVRWTEQRNFEAVLELMASGALDVAPLVSHRFAFDDAPRAYDALAADSTALGILLEYTSPAELRHNRTIELASGPGGAVPAGKPRLGVIGAGNYASRMLIPALRKGGAELVSICSAGGVSSAVQGGRAGFARATSDVEAVFEDSTINAVVLATRHDSHAALAIKGLKAGKHVFVEKPLAVSLEQLAELEAAFASTSPLLMVGFNRRFAPFVQRLQQLLASTSEPKSFVMVMNAGFIPPDHWTQDPHVGGGRIIGEACHHIDLMRFLARSPIVSVEARRIGNSEAVQVTEDKAVITLGFADGSFGTIHYLANGGSSFPKERIEVFVNGRTLQLDNFLHLRGFNWPGFRHVRSWRQDKGQTNCAAAFLAAVENGGRPPIPADELFEVARVSIEAAELIRKQ